MVLRCTTCKKEVTDDYIRFKCPGCKKELIRCNLCRGIAATYACNNCGFKGP